MWIVVIAAVLVELISIVQYQRLRRIMEEDLNIRSRIAMGAVADRVGYELAGTELTLQDQDFSWLGDTLNARQRLEYSFILLLTSDGKLVAGPSSDKIAPSEVEVAVQLIREGKDISADKKVAIRSITMRQEPNWRVVQVYHMDKVMAPIRKMRLQQMVLVLLALAILGFMIERFARSESKLQEASAEQARIAGELTVARNIQREMLPKQFPDHIFGTLEPALEVGGDLFDFYERDGKLFFCIGDVSGKGVPSAMLMSVIHSLFRVLSQKIESPSHILKALNEQLCRGNDSNMFVTFFAGCLDRYTGKLHFCNAGHDKPFLMKESATLLQAKPNLPLGVFPDTYYEDQVYELKPGDTLFLYTDGLTEAKNQDRELFGCDRVEAALNACLAVPGMSAERIVESLTVAAHSFSGAAPQSDDLTILVVQYAPGELVKEQITLKNQKEEISRLSDFVKAFFEQLSVEKKTAAGLRLALEESVVNVINYAYPKGEEGTVTIYADSNGKEVRFTIVDEGVAFDPTAVLPTDTTLDIQDRPIGGLGVHLTRKLVDTVTYNRKHGMNVLTLTKAI